VQLRKLIESQAKAPPRSIPFASRKLKALRLAKAERKIQVWRSVLIPEWQSRLKTQVSRLAWMLKSWATLQNRLISMSSSRLSMT